MSTYYLRDWLYPKWCANATCTGWCMAGAPPSEPSLEFITFNDADAVVERLKSCKGHGGGERLQIEVMCSDGTIIQADDFLQKKGPSQ